MLPKRLIVAIAALMLVANSMAEAEILVVQATSDNEDQQPNAIAQMFRLEGLESMVESKEQARTEYIHSSIWNVANGADDLGQVNKDFQSPLFISAIAGSLFGDAVTVDEDNVTLGFNREFGANGSRGTFNVQASFNRDPEISSGLLSQIASNEQAAFKAATENSFSLSDDATYSLEFKFARGLLCPKSKQRPDLHKRDTLAGLFSDAEDIKCQSSDDTTTLLDRARAQNLTRSISSIRQQLQAGNDKDPLNATNAILGVMNMEAGSRLTFLNGLQAANDPVSLFQGQKKLYESGSKLYLSLASKVRNELIGGDSMSYKLTYEWAIAIRPEKVEQQIRDAANQCISEIGQEDWYQEELNVLCALGARNAELAEVSDELDAAARFTFSAAYEDFESQRVTGLPGDVVFRQKGISKKRYSVGYGRQFTKIKWLGNTWFSIDAVYEDASDNDMLNDRVVSTISITKKFQDLPGFSLPFSIVYSNRPQFVIDNTDEKFSAQFGIQYSLTP